MTRIVTHRVNPVAIPKAIVHSFTPGKMYRIEVTATNLKEYYAWNCEFIYTAKKGIHHVFKSAHGTWNRTYTDQQLVGKFIKEIDND